MKIVDTLKLEASEWLWNLPKSNKAGGQIAEHVEALLRDGCTLIPNYLNANQLQALLFDGRRVCQDSQNISLESNGSDSRVYGVDRLADSFKLQGLTELPDKIAKTFYRADSLAWFQMLGHIVSTPNNLGSGSGWHRDSPFKHQFKFIIYLSDVQIENGPFEYIKGSHLKKSIESVASYLNVRSNKFRFDPQEIDRLENAEVVPPRTAIVAPAGSMLMADVRGLHRGSPLLQGERWALTRYYFENEIPEHFTSNYAILNGR